MELDHLLAQCTGFEARAAAVYRTFAARTRHDPALCALWTAMARDEDEHARALARASTWLDTVDGWHTDLSGWAEAIEEIEQRLAEAERPDIAADPDRQLLAALALERTELDTLFGRLLGVMRRPDTERFHGDHHQKLLAVASRSTNSAVQLEAALLGARTRLGSPSPAARV